MKVTDRLARLEANAPTPIPLIDLDEVRRLLLADLEFFTATGILRRPPSGTHNDTPTRRLLLADLDRQIREQANESG